MIYRYMFSYSPCNRSRNKSSDKDSCFKSHRKHRKSDFSKKSKACSQSTRLV